MGTGRVRRRLRQRRLRRSVRHVLGHEPALSQSRRRDVRGGDESRRGWNDRAVALGRRLRLPRLRPRRPARSLRRQLHRSSIWRRRPCRNPGLCRYKGLPVACGPPGLPGGKNVLYRNAGDGTFADVSDGARASPARSGTYGLGVSTLDFDDDGWVDLYVANDSNPSALYRNNRDGTFTDIGVAAGCAYSQDGKPQAGMGVAIGDYDRDGTMDIFKTNFAGDTSTLYANTGKGLCEDRTFAGGFGRNTRWLGWGVGFVDLDQRRLARSLPRQRPRLSRGRAAEDRGRLQAAQGRLPQPRRRALRRRHRTAGTAGDDARKPGAARPSPTSTTTATSTSSSTTFTTRRTFALDQRRPAALAALQLVGTRSNRSAIGARVQLIDGRRRCRSGSTRRRQLLLAERSARALRARTCDRASIARSALAERPRRSCGPPSRPTVSSRSPRARRCR